MTKHLYKIILLFMVAAICSCSSGQVIPEYPFVPASVRFHLKSDPKLNLYRGGPHTLMLCVYFLKDPNAFNQLADDQDGLPKLLECTRFDPSVTYTKKIVVHPNKELTEMLDRAEGAKYVGVVAGYYSLQKDKVTRLYNIPPGRSTSKNPEIIDIDLYLSPQAIREEAGK